MTKKGKVYVAMSGGVDSSVSALLLKKEGYQVVGVFIKTWSPSWLPCNWPKERRDAMRVAAKIDIPFLTADFSVEYKNEVVDYLISEYKNGRTPNPDVMCNKEIKFGSFLKWAESKNADHVATGHYARVSGGNLLAGRDKEKDQSYFLWTLKKEQLDKIIFPVGDLLKEKVRKIALENELLVSSKKDSQGICFLGKIDLETFLHKYLEIKEGDILNEKGEVIGRHRGSIIYTIGQRHGFTINKKGIADTPMYVISKDLNKNIITVSSEKPEMSKMATKIIELEDSNWRQDPDENKKYKARTRYRQPLEDCLIKDNKVYFENPQAVAPGQSVVVYDGEVVLGGGVAK